MDAFANTSIAADVYAMPKIDASASAASRQKSCNACVRGKRRCDKRSPRCTRCAAKGLDCVYQKLPPSALSSATDGTSTTTTTISGAASTAESSGTSPEMADMPDFDMGFDMESLGTETSPESQHHHHIPHHHMPSAQAVNMPLGPELDFDIVDFMNAGSNANNTSLFNFNSAFTETSNKMQLNPLPTAPTVEIEPSPIRDLSLLKPDDACIGVDPSEAHDPRTCAGFMVKEISSLHEVFAKTRATPFMHPQLWAGKLPKTMLSAFSAASAYATSTPENKSWIMKLVANSAVQIHREGENANTNAEKLARVQALVVLDVIRVFDGDLSLRASADRERSVLLSWMKELRPIAIELEAEAELLGGGSCTSRDRPPKSWESWVFLESIRRTQLVCTAFLCLQVMLRQDDAPEEMWAPTSFTASKSLWEATSSVEFYKAWREKPQYFIRNFDFKEFWQYGRLDDMDEFTRLMLTPQVGVDAMEHFLAGDVSIPI